jgi:hypothetical protein
MAKGDSELNAFFQVVDDGSNDGLAALLLGTDDPMRRQMGTHETMQLVICGYEVDALGGVFVALETGRKVLQGCPVILERDQPVSNYSEVDIVRHAYFVGMSGDLGILTCLGKGLSKEELFLSYSRSRTPTSSGMVS